MTPRTYWDEMGNLWEFREVNGTEWGWLLWSPAAPVVGTNCHGSRMYIEDRLGPLVATC